MLYLHKYGNHKDVLARITEPIYELETLFDNCKMLYQNEKIILFTDFRKKKKSITGTDS